MTTWETGDLGREAPGPTSTVGAVSTEPQRGGGTSQTKEVASEQARQVASTTVEQGKQVAATAGESAKDVAAEAKEQASQVVQQVSTQARSLIGDARSELRGQAHSQTERLAGGLRDVARQVEALTTGRPAESGIAGDYARQIGSKVNEVADRLESRGFDGLIDDVEDFARRRPGVFLLGAAALGFAAGRVLRGARAATSEGSRQTSVPEAEAELSRPVAPALGPDLARPAVDYAGAPIAGEDSGAIIEPTPSESSSEYAQAPYGQPGRL